MNEHSAARNGAHQESSSSNPGDLEAYHKSIAELSQKALIESHLDVLLAAATAHIVPLLGVEYCGVFELQEDGTGLVLRAGYGWRDGCVLSAILPAESVPVSTSGILPDDSLEIPRLFVDHGIVSAIAADIEARDQGYGLLGVYSTKKRTFLAHEVEYTKAIAHVISEAVRLDETRETRNTRLEMQRAIARQMPALVWTTDSELRILHALGSGLNVFADYARYLGKTLFDFFGTQYVNCPPIAAHVTALKGRVATVQYRLKGLLLDIRVEPLLDPENGIVGCVGTAIELGKLDNVERQLRLLSTAVESAANAVVIADREGKITWINPAFTQITGYSLEEVSGSCFLGWSIDEEDLHKERWKTILSGQVWHGEVVSQRKDGSHYTELQTVTPVWDSDEHISHYISIRQDITKYKELETQLRQAQKMEAVGKLAGGVAHDFNNLLTAIVGYSDLLLNDLHDDDPRRPDLLAIKRSARRASSLTRQLLAFSRRQVLQPKVLDLNAVVTNLGKMLRRLIGEDVELITSLDSSLGRTKADIGQVEQVIVNLVLNARDAMPDGGRLILETKNVQLDEACYQGRPVVKSGPYVMLAVSDTGPGIDKELLSRVFEPFFTTKGEGKGAGLGLSTVYGIVRQSGGYIFVYSEFGIGTTFKTYLPRLDDDLEIDEVKDETAHVSGSETVLLVEDEDEVRCFTKRVLMENGYRVLEARNGAEAFLLSQEHEGPIQLLLADVIMPFMNGPEVANHQSRVRPDMKVLYMSGYADEAIARHGVLEPGIAFIQKPFATSALLSKVREVLDSPAGQYSSTDLAC